MQENSYQKGMLDGLTVGKEKLKVILEDHTVSIDDVLDMYNDVVKKAHTAYQNMLQENPQLDMYGEENQEEYYNLGGRQ